MRLQGSLDETRDKRHETKLSKKESVYESGTVQLVVLGLSS
jgi:hypothetical protein